MVRALVRRSFQGTIPSASMCPDVGTRMPVSILMVVDFPAPFGPRYPTISPSSMRREMSSTARVVIFCVLKKDRRPDILPSTRRGLLNS